MSQIQRDLENQIRNKLDLWVKDSLALFEMAELNPNDARRVIIARLIALVAFTTAAWMNPRDDHAMLAALVQALKTARQEMKSCSPQKRLKRSYKGTNF